MHYKKLTRKFGIDGSDFLPAGLSIETTIFLPEEPGSNVALFLFPGAGCSRDYFDIQYGDGSYSQAEFHANRGITVVAVDHLGAGGSSLTGYDHNTSSAQASDLTLKMMGAACDAVVRLVAEKLRDGTLDCACAPLPQLALIGAGQSMGGHIVTIAQAHHTTFDGIALLGSSVTQSRLTLLPGRRYPLRNSAWEKVMIGVAMDSDMRACFHWPDEPEDLVEMNMQPKTTAPWRSKAIPVCAAQLMEPAIVAKEAAAVKVPVLLVYGEIDVTAEPLNDVAMFRSTCDISLLVVPQMAHMHNFAATRSMVWRRLHDFSNQVAAAKA